MATAVNAIIWFCGSARVLHAPPKIYLVLLAGSSALRFYAAACAVAEPDIYDAAMRRCAHAVGVGRGNRPGAGSGKHP